MNSIKNLCLQQGLAPTIFIYLFIISITNLVDAFSFMPSFLAQMIQLTSVLALSVEIAPQACTMASSPARAARASSSAASATSVCTAAAVTRTARCHASSATAASTAACSSVCKWGWTAKVKRGHGTGTAHSQYTLTIYMNSPLVSVYFYFTCRSQNAFVSKMRTDGLYQI